LDDGGYLLVALLIGIAIASIWMAAALPAWRQQAIREKEAELAFRGEQYARAIFLYQQQMHTMPSSFDDLISQHLLRKKWKDPITGEDFLPRIGCAGVGGGSPTGGRGTNPPPNSNPGRNNLPPNSPPLLMQNVGRIGQQGVGRQGPGGTGIGGPGGGFPQVPNIGAPGQQPGVGGIGGGGLCGVQSKSKATSIRTYNGQQEYDLWQFDMTTAAQLYQRDVAKLGGTAVPGQGIGMPIGIPGRGGIPGNRGPIGPGTFGPNAPGRGGFPGPNGPRGTPPNRGFNPQPINPGGPIGRGRG
jgi:type II secretory pathway pseudopilin PulG